MSASVLIWMISSFRWDIWFKVILFFLKSSGMYGILLSLLSVVILSVYIIFPEKVRYFYFKRCRKLCQGLFFHFAKIIIFSENLSFFCCFFSFFAPTIVAFASMIVAFGSMIVAFGSMIVAFASTFVTFGPAFVTFASMILLSYSSFECLSHTPYL